MIKQRAQFCNRLKQARQESGLKQENVAKYLKIPVSAVSSVESGKRKLDALELHALSKLYNKPVGWFFGDHEAISGPPDLSLTLSGDDDPILLECLKLLRGAPKNIQRSAAYGVIGFLSER